MAASMKETDSTTRRGRTPSVLVPPINFSLVSRGVYRSGHPNRKNFPFLLGLSLKTIIYLESTTYRPDSQSFIDTSAVALHTYGLSDESKLFSPEGKQAIEEILKMVLDTRNHPVLLHDDMGKSIVSLICALRVTCLLVRLADLKEQALAKPDERFVGTQYDEISCAHLQYIAMFNPKRLDYDAHYKPEWID